MIYQKETLILHKLITEMILFFTCYWTFCGGGKTCASDLLVLWPIKCFFYFLCRLRNHFDPILYTEYFISSTIINHIFILHQYIDRKKIMEYIYIHIYKTSTTISAMINYLIWTMQEPCHRDLKLSVIHSLHQNCSQCSATSMSVRIWYVVSNHIPLSKSG